MADARGIATRLALSLVGSAQKVVDPFEELPTVGEETEMALEALMSATAAAAQQSVPDCLKLLQSGMTSKVGHAETDADFDRIRLELDRLRQHIDTELVLTAHDLESKAEGLQVVANKLRPWLSLAAHWLTSATPYDDLPLDVCVVQPSQNQPKLQPDPRHTMPPPIGSDQADVRAATAEQILQEQKLAGVGSVRKMTTTLKSDGGGFVANITAKDGYTHVSISAGEGGALTWASAKERLQSDTDFRLLMTNVLKSMTYRAYFWECAPLSNSTAKLRPFEFVILEAPENELTKAADPKPFSEHLDALRGQHVVKTFPNLAGDSFMVSPAQATENADAYANIAVFFRNAPADQHDLMWLELGKSIERFFSEVNPDGNLWVSTEGSAVSWLHMRLDPKPKYYHHDAYKAPNFGL